MMSAVGVRRKGHKMNECDGLAYLEQPRVHRLGPGS